MTKQLRMFTKLNLSIAISTWDSEYKLQINFHNPAMQLEKQNDHNHMLLLTKWP